MLNFILLQAGGLSLGDNFYFRIFIAIVVLYIFFFIHVYIFRAIFKTPSFLKYQKAQVPLLEELAKTQGVEASKFKALFPRHTDGKVQKNIPYEKLNKKSKVFFG